MKLFAIFFSLCLAAGGAFADEPGDMKAEKSVDQSTSTNPLTGTKTTTKHYKKKHKDGAGKAEDTVTQKTKVGTDGSKSTTTETTTSEEPKK